MNAKYARNCDVDVSSWQIFEKRMNPKYVTSTCVVVIVLSTSNDHYQPFNDCNDDFSGGEYYELRDPFTVGPSAVLKFTSIE